MAMAQWLRAVDGLAEDLGSVLSIAWQLTTVGNSDPRGSDTLFWPHPVYGQHGGTIKNKKKSL